MVACVDPVFSSGVWGVMVACVDPVFSSASVVFEVKCEIILVSVPAEVVD